MNREKKTLLRKASALSELAEKRAGQILNLKDKIAQQSASISNLKDKIEQQSAGISNLKGKIEQQSTSLSNLKVKIKERDSSLESYRKNRIINTCLTFAQKTRDRAQDLEAEVYCGHGVQTLPAIHELKEVSGGKTVCDVIEIPEFSSRVSKFDWDSSVFKMIEYGLDNYLRKSDHLLTVSWELQSNLLRRHNSVNVLPNFRKHIPISPNNYLRQKHDIPNDAKIIVCISTLSPSFEKIFEAMQALPNNIHLVTLGTFISTEYQARVNELVVPLGISDRVHFSPPVPYEGLIDVISSADLGLIILDTSIENVRVSLPNRVFDYVAAGLPILSSFIPDINALITEYNCGVSVRGDSKEAWVKGVQKILASQMEMSENAQACASENTWESIEPKLSGFFLNKRSISFIGIKDLQKNNRTMRIADSLKKQGVNIKIACPFSENTPNISM